MEKSLLLFKACEYFFKIPELRSLMPLTFWLHISGQLLGMHWFYILAASFITSLTDSLKILPDGLEGKNL